MEESDTEKFTDAVAEYDSVSKLDKVCKGLSLRFSLGFFLKKIFVSLIIKASFFHFFPLFTYLVKLGFRFMLAIYYYTAFMNFLKL